MSPLFCHIGWMARYRGLRRQPDKIVGGGAWVDEHGTGGEVCNFLPCADRYVYGHVETLKGDQDRHINIQHLGAEKGSDYIDGVSVVWTATDPNQGGRRVIGRYKNARVYRERQKFDQIPSPQHDIDSLKDFRIRARAEDAALLPLDERELSLPHAKKGWMGHAQWWFPKENENLEVRRFIRDVERAFGERSTSSSRTRWGRTTDLDRKVAVEQAAVNVVKAHFRELPSKLVHTVERENLGWDLEVRSSDAKVLLELEVKGLFGPDPQIGLTPNEYRVLKEHEDGNRNRYRLCVVTNALSKQPKLHVFNHDNGSWRDEIAGCRAALTITPQTAAIISLPSGSTGRHLRR